MKHYAKFYIGGEWVDPVASPRTFELVNPATEKPFATISMGGAADVDRAVNAARASFVNFSVTSKADRIALLERIVDGMKARASELMAAATEQMGAPRSAVGVVQAGVEAFQQAIVTLASYEFETPKRNHIVRREPIGVCGLISAWNHPLQILCTKLSMALAAGCTVVAKPSEFTPVSAIQLAEILHAAGVPKGFTVSRYPVLPWTFECTVPAVGRA